MRAASPPRQCAGTAPGGHPRAESEPTSDDHHPPRPGALEARYQELYQAASNGHISPDDTLAGLSATDGAGSVWQINPDGQFVRAQFVGAPAQVCDPATYIDPDTAPAAGPAPFGAAQPGPDPFGAAQPGPDPFAAAFASAPQPDPFAAPPAAAAQQDGFDQPAGLAQHCQGPGPGWPLPPSCRRTVNGFGRRPSTPQRPQPATTGGGTCPRPSHRCWTTTAGSWSSPRSTAAPGPGGQSRPRTEFLTHHDEMEEAGAVIRSECRIATSG